jgi:hypothetical protein
MCGRWENKPTILDLLIKKLRNQINLNVLVDVAFECFSKVWLAIRDNCHYCFWKITILEMVSTSFGCRSGTGI